MLYINHHPEILHCFQNDRIEISIHEIICNEDNSGEEAYQLYNNQRDFNKPIFNNDEYRCLNLDLLECVRRDRRKARKKNNPSMDIAFFVEEDGKKFTVLIEFRLNYKVISNIKKDDLDKKVKYSTSFSKHFLKLPIYPKQYFVFPSKKRPEFERRLRRMNPQCSPNYIAVDVINLYNTFFT